MERRRREVPDNNLVNGELNEENSWLSATEYFVVGKPELPSALEMAFTFLETGSLDVDLYYEVRWKHYDKNSSIE